jgi:DNA-binding transcriptional LysR family regulator
MDLTTIKYIVTIAEEKKLASASEKLHITTSALSQCVKKLEHDLGVPLFEKIDSRTFLLTMAGKIYVEAGRRILKIKEDAYREIQDVCHATRGEFAFGCSPKRGLAVFSNVFPAFYKAYPNVRIELLEASLNDLFHLVLDGKVDIAIVTPQERDLETVDSELLDEEEIALNIPAHHPLAHLASASGEGTISVEKLSLFKNDNWVLSNKGSMHRNFTDELFSDAGFSPDRVLLETSSTNPHLIAIEEGIAVGFVPVQKANRNPKVAILHLEPRRYRKLYAVYRKNYRLSESQRFLIDEIRNFYTSSKEASLPAYRLGW